MASVEEAKASVEITQVLEHPDLPGVKTFLFGDGTAVVADSTGKMSPVQKATEDSFTSLGWTVQDT